MILAYSYRDEKGKYYYPEQVDRDGDAFRVKDSGAPVTTQVEKMSKSRYNVVNPDEVVKNYGADSGLIATVQILSELTRTDDVLSKVRVPFERYSQSGEINTHVDDVTAVLDRVSATLSDGAQDHLDGLTVEYGTWWFNLRPSNTEPLLRLNLEAETRDECDTRVAELLALITSS